jgi:hypothetical protein
MELSRLVPISRELAQALPHEGALSGLELIERGDVTAGDIFGDIGDDRGVLAEEAARRFDGDPLRIVDGGPWVVAAEDEIGIEDARNGAVGKARRRWARGRARSPIFRPGRARRPS